MTQGTSHSMPSEGIIIHWAARYDRLIHLLSLGQTRQFYKRIAREVHVQAGDHVLDIGCGTGELSIALALQTGSNGYVAGIDASPEMIVHARKKAQGKKISIDFREESAAQLSFADGSFDKVVSSFVFHHLPDDLKQQALQEILRVLKPDGQFMLIDFAGDKMKGNAHEDDYIHHLLSDAGFTNVVQTPIKKPFAMQVFFLNPITCIAAHAPAYRYLDYYNNNQDICDIQLDL